MKAIKTGILGIVFASFLLQLLPAQSVGIGNAGGNAAGEYHSRVPKAFQGFRIPPSAPLRFLASDEGRSFLKASGHPLAQYAIQAFGEPSQAAVASAARFQEAASGSRGTFSGRTVSERFEEAAHATAVPCSGNSGARFNLEPRANALPQNQANADFLPNRIAAGDDLIVQAANDYRGNLTHGPWDQNVSGYYVHRSTSADCSVQFEGGLPSFSFQGNKEMGIGNAVVAADPARDAFFMADVRFAKTGGVGLFRASASTLLNTKACASGTHSQAQATSCWAATPPALLFPQAGFDSVNDLPSIAVDERSSGTGAGNVYVASTQFSFAQQTSTIALAACNNALICSTALSVSGSDTSSGLPDVRVRPNGGITISYLVSNSDGSETIKFVVCTPAVAPKLPTCGAPLRAQNIAHSIAPANASPVQTELVNMNLITFTFPKHTHRAESGNAFTTFLVYDDCRHPLQQGNPVFTQCLDAEVLMTTSTDEGKTWSAPVSVDRSAGHHFYPAIATDASTGFVNIAYYSTEGDKFNHNVRVLLNQIAPGTTKIGPAKFMTTTLTPIDSDPGNTGLLQFEMFIGVVARGTSSGQSKAYTSFHTNTVSGTYGARPLPEENNHISAFVF